MLAFGTPGGDQQDQWELRVPARPRGTSGCDLQEAIDAPMFHTDHFPSSFYPRETEPRSLALEDAGARTWQRSCGARGHDVTVADAWSLGRVSAVARDDGVLAAGANPRGMQGYAVGR